MLFRSGRHLTYRGQKLFLHPSGDIVGNNQQVVDAVQENKPRPKPQSNTKVGNSSIKTESDSKNKNTDESISQPQSNHSDDKSKQEVPNTDSNHKVKIVTKGATSSDIKRINERYKELELLINDEFNNVSSISKKVYASSSVSYATEKTNSNSVEANSPMESSEKNESVSPEGKKEDGLSPLQEFNGQSFYAFSTEEANTDFNDVVELEFFGVKRSHKLYKAKAYAKLQLKYDHVVLNVKRVCPPASKCITVNAIVLDPNNSSAGLEADIDNHFWYRYGGLFVSSLAMGGSTAVSESAERVEEVDGNGARSVISGLKGDKLYIKAAGEVGKAFAPTLAQNMSRPPTGKLEKHRQVKVKFMPLGL